jgi:Ras-related protein Rab-28
VAATGRVNRVLLFIHIIVTYYFNLRSSGFQDRCLIGWQNPECVSLSFLETAPPAKRVSVSASKQTGSNEFIARQVVSDGGGGGGGGLFRMLVQTIGLDFDELEIVVQRDLPDCLMLVQTIGLDFYEREIVVQGTAVTLQIWDIGGQSLASSLVTTYVYNSAVIWLVYDVTDAQSFADVEDWHATVKRTLDAKPQTRPPAIYLVGNKVDLQHLRKVSEASHGAFVEERGLSGGFFISARSGEAVLSSFYEAAAKYLGKTVTSSELEALRKVIGVSVVATGDDEARTAEADRIEREDAAAEERKRSGGCCCVQ